MKKFTFLALYIFGHLAFLYTALLTALLVFFRVGDSVPGTIALSPIFLAVPAWIFIFTLRCPHCNEVIYTVENVKSAGGNRLPLPIVEECPKCGEAVF